MMLLLLLLAAAPASTCAMEHLALELPSSYACEQKRGPDFSIFHVQSGQASGNGSIGIYLGNHPRAFAPEEGTATQRMTLGRRHGRWTLWVKREAGSPDVFMAEASLDRPFGIEPGYSQYLHIFVSAPTAAVRDELKTLALAIRPAGGGK